MDWRKVVYFKRGKLPKWRSNFHRLTFHLFLNRETTQTLMFSQKHHYQRPILYISRVFPSKKKTFSWLAVHKNQPLQKRRIKINNIVTTLVYQPLNATRYCFNKRPLTWHLQWGLNGFKFGLSLRTLAPVS